ncbi:MAG: ATP-binding protein [Candidatus Paceibacterota bacterium]|jgi:signal transduction histidine kinase
MTFYAFSALFNFFTSLGLGLFVLVKNKNNKTSQTFSAFAFTIAFWSFFYYLWQIADNSDSALFWCRVLMAGAIFIPVTYLHFVVRFLNIQKQKIFLILSYILFSLFLLFDITPLFVSHVEPLLGFAFWPIAGPIFSIFLPIWLAYVVYSSYLLYQRYRSVEGLQRLQIRYVLLGMILGFAGGSTNYFLWYYIPIPPIFNIFTSAYVATVAYSIIRYRLMDIRIVARKIFIFVGASVVAYLTYYAILWFENNLLGGAYSSKSFLIGVVIAGLFVTLFQYSSRWIEKLANKYFFFSLYNYQETINRVSGQLTHYTDLSKINDLVSATIKESLGVTRVEINLFDKNSRSAKKDLLVKYLQTNQRPVVLEELNILVNDERLKDQRETFSAVYEQVKNLGASICLPMVSNERLIGIIILGPKVIGDPFTVEDLELLMTLSNQAAIAIDNAELYKEVKDFNKTLKQKVNEQTMSLQDKTKVLEEQAEHLKKLLAMRSEFLDIASHQLKTPISVISGTISMFKEGSVQKMPVETQNKLIDNIYQKSLKISQIIRDILQASEFDTEKFSFVEKRIVPVDLNKMLTDVVADNKAFADEKKLQLIFTPNPANPQINSDPDYLEQAFFNLVDNALKYTKEGKVEVSLDENPQSIIIKVKDTGVGIPKDDQVRMFGKFERAKNAVDMYTDGSGLGLFITKEIIEAHPGGTIAFASEEGKGTEFTITIPKTKK